MDWEKYAKELEIIIDTIPMSVGRRSLVDGLIEIAKRKCEKSSC